MHHITPSNNVEAFNRIANHPSVLPYVVQKGQHDLDFADFFLNPRNIGFLGSNCAFIAHYLDAGMYEVHSMALPEARGRTVLLAATEAINFMFLSTPCMELLTRVVAGNVAADALAKAVGFHLEFVRPKAWNAPDGAKDCRYYAMRYPDWVKRQGWLCESGGWFHHDVLGDDRTHEDDAAHDLHVGACVEMVRAGQARKGVILYNRWARFAGYEPVEIVADDPVTIDIKSHIIRFDGESVGAVPCQ